MKLIQKNRSTLLVLFIFKLTLVFLSQNAMAAIKPTQNDHCSISLELRDEFNSLKKLSLEIKEKKEDPKKTMEKILSVLGTQIEYLINKNNQNSLLIASELTEQLKIASLSILLNKKVNVESCYKSTKHILRSLTVVLRFASHSLQSTEKLSITNLQQAFLLLHIRASPAPELIKHFAKNAGEIQPSAEPPISWEKEIPINKTDLDDISSHITTTIFSSDLTDNLKHSKPIAHFAALKQFHSVYSKAEDEASFSRMLYQAALLIMTTGAASKPTLYNLDTIEADHSTTINTLSSLDFIDVHTDHLQREEMKVLLHICGQALSESSSFTPFPFFHMVSIFIAKRVLHKIAQLFSNDTALATILSTTYSNFTTHSLENRLDRINSHIDSMMSLHLKSTSTDSSQPNEECLYIINDILKQLLYIYEESSKLAELSLEVSAEEAVEQIKSLQLTKQPLASFTRSGIFLEESSSSELLLNTLQENLTQFHSQLMSIKGKVNDLKKVDLPNFITKLSSPVREQGEKTLDRSVVNLILGSLKKTEHPSGDYSETLALMLANLAQESVVEPSMELTKRLKSFANKEGVSAVRTIGKSYHKVVGFFGKLKQWICSSANSQPLMDIITNGSSLTSENIIAFRNMLTALTDRWDDDHLSVNSTFAPQEPIASPNTLTRPEDIKTAQELLIVALRETELQCSDFSHETETSHFFKMIYRAFVEAQDNPVDITADLSEHQQSITTLSGILKYMAVSLSDQPCETCHAMKDSLQQLLGCSNAACSASKFMLYLDRRVKHNQQEFSQFLAHKHHKPIFHRADFNDNSSTSSRLTTIAFRFIDNLSSLLITPAVGKNNLHLDMLLYCACLPSYLHKDLWIKAKRLYLIHRKINGQYFSRAFQELSEKNNSTLRLLHKTARTGDQYLENIKQLTELAHPSYTPSRSVQLAAQLPAFSHRLLSVSTQQKTRVYQRETKADSNKKTPKKVSKSQWKKTSKPKDAAAITVSSIQEEPLLSDKLTIVNEVTDSLLGPSEPIQTHSASDGLQFSTSPKISEEQKKEKDTSAEKPMTDAEAFNLITNKDKRLELMTDEIITKFNHDDEYRKKVCMIAIDLFQPFTGQSNELKQAVDKIRDWVLTGVGKIGKKTSTILAVIVSSAVIISSSSGWFGLMKRFAKKFINISALTSFINQHGSNAELLVRSQDGTLFEFPETSDLLKSSEGISSELHNIQYFQDSNGDNIRRTPGATDSGFLTFNCMTTIALTMFNLYGVYISVHPQQERLAVFDQSENLALLTGKLPTAYIAQYLKEKKLTSKQTPSCVYKARDALENPCNSCGSEASLCSTCLWQTLTNCLSIQCILQTSKTILPTPSYSYEEISAAARNAILAAAAGVMSKNLVFDMLKLVLNARIKDMLTQGLTGLMLFTDYSFSATQKSAMVNNFTTAAEHYQVNTVFKNLEHRILNPDNPVPFTETDKKILKHTLTPEAYHHYVTVEDATTPVPCCNSGCRMGACGTCLQGTSCLCAGVTCALFSAIPCLAAVCDTTCLLSQKTITAAKAAAQKSMEYYSVNQFPNNIVSPDKNKIIAEYTQIAKAVDKLIHVVADNGKEKGLTKALTMFFTKGSQSVGQMAQISAYLDRLGWKQEHKAYLLIALVIGGKDCLTGNFARWAHLQGDDLLRTVADVLDQLDTPITNVIEGHARETDNITQPYGLVNMGEHLAKQAMSKHWQSDDTSIMEGQVAFEEKIASFLKFGVDGIEMMTQPFHKYQQERMQEFFDKAHSGTMTPPTHQQLDRQAAVTIQPKNKPCAHCAEQEDYQKLLEHLDVKPETDTNTESTIGQILYQAKKVLSTKQLTESQKALALQSIALEINKHNPKNALIKRLIKGRFYQETCEFKGFSVLPTIQQQQPISMH